jgi:hypothetical protein
MGVITTHNPKRFLAQYDRGTFGYRPPRGYAIPLDAADPGFEMWIHWQVPPHCILDSTGFEISGLDLYVTSIQPEQNAFLVGATYGNSEANAGAAEDVYGPGALQNFGPKAKLLAVYIHTHDQFKWKWLEILDRLTNATLRSQAMQISSGTKEPSYQNLGDMAWQDARPDPEFLIASVSRIRAVCTMGSSNSPVTQGWGPGQSMCSLFMCVASDVPVSSWLASGSRHGD